MEAEDDTKSLSALAAELALGLPLDPLPSPSGPSPGVPHAPRRTPNLTAAQTKQALRNALRYFPTELHATLAPEFAQELRDEGHIYMRRFRPRFRMRAYPIDVYPAQSKQTAAIQLMIMNNLDPDVAQFPEELITYGGNGSVFSNWAQFRLVMYYLSKMTEHQTLVMYSGHPMGLFPSDPSAPRVVVTNGMTIPNYSSREDYDRMYALGVSQYGQMTAGSYAYIGPQGIVHGTTLTLLGAGRKYLGKQSLEGSGTVFVTSGLGGMSGAQPKAGVICGTITVVAEVDPAALEKRHAQGWVLEVAKDLDHLIQRIKQAKRDKESTSVAYLGNIVTLWRRLAEEAEKADGGELLVELGSDQTSCHNVFGGGYYPHQVSFEEGKALLADDPARFRQLVEESLRDHVEAINRLTAKGMRFWDYGNSFLLEASRAGADIWESEAAGAFRYPSYVQDIMGDIFSLGFGPFRWVCTSGKPEDLRLTDRLAGEVMSGLRDAAHAAGSPSVGLYDDNLLWIREADSNQLVVGSQARILYAGSEGRVQIAQAFNAAVADGRLAGCVVVSRDHHDTSGTDSPFRETSNITDGSQFCADMAVQNFVGDSFRGATWISLHNGGGVGWGEVVNGGFGLVLDGTADAAERSAKMLFWDVNNGIARRAWAGNANAEWELEQAEKREPLLRITKPKWASEAVLDAALGSPAQEQ